MDEAPLLTDRRTPFMLSAGCALFRRANASGVLKGGLLSGNCLENWKSREILRESRYVRQVLVRYWSEVDFVTHWYCVTCGSSVGFRG